MKYEIRQLSWSKRRTHTENKEILNVRLEDYKEEINHFCKMYISYDNEAEIELTARVTYNDIQDYWIVAGINTKGDQCSIKILKK